MTSACAAPFVQIAVFTLAGSTIETRIPHGASSTRNEVGDRLERMLRRRVRTEKRERAPPSDRAHQHHTSLRLCEAREGTPAARRPARRRSPRAGAEARRAGRARAALRSRCRRCRRDRAARRQRPRQRPRSATESVTSSWSGSTPCPRSRSASSSPRTPPKTRQPEPASRRADAWPIPDDAPVTRTARATS